MVDNVYIVFHRKLKKIEDRCRFSKQFQMGEKVTYFIRRNIAYKFPKRGHSRYAMNMADLILVDGRVYKNKFSGTEFGVEG